jgi:NADPH2:quinone reductase
MQALVVSAGTSTGLALRQVQAPQAEADQHLIRVLASSINRGERTRLAAAPEGHLFGWDVVGEVVTPAALAPATPIGTVVVGLAGDGGGWAEQVAIRASDTAPLNENVPIAVAAALPVAGLTALRATRLHPSLLGARVLVIGSGAVAWYAVQCAALAGADVHVAVRSEEASQRMVELGASEAFIVPRAWPKGYDVVIDSVGGLATAAALAAARTFGRVVVIGNVGEGAAAITSGMLLASGAMLQGYRTVVDSETNPLGADLATLQNWLASGRLRAPEVQEIEWSDDAQLAQAIDGGLGNVRAVLRVARP